MTDVLGFRRNGAHGSDIGAIVCDQLCRRAGDALADAHLTDVPVTIALAVVEELTEAEANFLARRRDFQGRDGSYAHLQGAEPWKLAVGLDDSPAGPAAWIAEKMQAWSDCDDAVERWFSKDELLTNVMPYWVTGSIGTSFLGHPDLMETPSPSTPAVADDLRPRPPAAGYATFPKDIVNAPRTWAERFYGVQQWSDCRRAATSRPEMNPNCWPGAFALSSGRCADPGWNDIDAAVRRTELTHATD